MGWPVADNLTYVDYRRASDFGLSSDKLSKNALRTLKTLQQAGYKAYVVGGCVRDLFIGIEPKDFDIATDAHPKQVIKHFSRCRIIGRRFKIVHVRYGRDLLEVSTFRSVLNDKNTADVRMSDTGMLLRDNQYGCLEDDILRRDFTVNALYYDPFNDQLIGHADSVSDLECRRIRTIGDAWQRYCEDPVRMLRAVRFCAKTGLIMDKDTERHIAPSVKHLSNVSPARLFEEVVKLFHSGKALKSYRLLCQYGLFKELAPLVHQCLEEDRRYRLLLEKLFSNTDQRIAENKSITPAFMMAVMIWIPAWSRRQKYIEAGETPRHAWRCAVNEVIEEQRQYISMPRYLGQISREICLLQPEFFSRNENRLYTVLEHKRFRAAYDLLRLCADAGFVSSDIAKWWEDVQELDASEYDEMIMRRVTG